MGINIAIDGPSGAGKSTQARKLAERLHYIYVDTGALYRTVGLYVYRQGVDPRDEEAVAAILPEIEVSLRFIGGEQHVYLNGEDVSADIRIHEVSQFASLVSAIPAVRQFLFELQRSMAAENDVVMDGRDIGTVVLPHADVKIFLTASAEVRAGRRFAELQERGQVVTFEQVLADIKKRDEQDETRPIAPLKPAEDSILVDNSACTAEESLALLYKTVTERLNKG